MMKKILLLILGIGVVGGIIGYFQWNKPHQDIAAATEDLTINANKLLNAFEADETKAESLYLDKLIIVNGIIKSIEKDDVGDITVILATESDMATILCNLDPLTDHGSLSLKIGENVRLKGLCSGFLMDVVMDRCVLSQN